MELQTTEQIAKSTKLSARTYEKYRLAGSGPRFVKLGRRCLYDPRDVAAWVEQHKVRNTAEAAVRHHAAA